MAPCPRFEIRRRYSFLRRRYLYRVALIATNCEVLSVSEHLESEAAALTNVEAQRAVISEQLRVLTGLDLWT